MYFSRFSTQIEIIPGGGISADSGRQRPRRLLLRSQQPSKLQNMFRRNFLPSSTLRFDTLKSIFIFALLNYALKSLAITISCTCNPAIGYVSQGGLVHPRTSTADQDELSSLLQVRHLQYSTVPALYWLETEMADSHLKATRVHKTSLNVNFKAIILM